ncbi:hypothetical protein [Pseudomonas sp. LB1P83]
MKSHELQSLLSMRQLREQRAASQLAAQQQRCRQTHEALENARECLGKHHVAIEREVESLFGRIIEGLSIAAWQADQNRLDELEDAQWQLESAVYEVRQILDGQEREREVFRVARAARQRQADAWKMLVERREQSERLAYERREESDELFVPLPGGAP